MRVIWLLAATVLNWPSLDKMKGMIDAFPNAVFKQDAGVRMRIVSYADLLPDMKNYRFGVVEDVVKATRLYRNLDSVWQTFGQMREGALTNKLQWNRAVSKQCLAIKQDEILNNNSRLLERIKSCSKLMISSMNAPAVCSDSELFAGSGLQPASPGCPATTKLVGNTLSQFDYRLFYPAIKEPGALDNCTQPSNDEVQKIVRSQWLKPVIDSQCSIDSNQPQCYNSTRAELLKNIHVVDRPAPKLPSGGYSRSCKQCKTVWQRNNKGKMQCSCSRDGSYKNTKWIQLQCPQKKPLQNCKRVLKYTKSC